MISNRLKNVIEFCDDMFYGSVSIGVLPSLKSIMSQRFRPFAVSGVYFLFSGNDLIYIGQSTNVMRRISDHAGNGPASHLAKKGVEFDSYAYISVPEQDLDAVERRMINEHKPLYNERLITP